MTEKSDLKESGTATLPAEKSGTFAPLLVPAFRLLAAGTVCSYAIQWIQSVVVNWLVYDLTGSGTILGTISVVSSVFSLGMLFAAGLLVDAFSRRKIMLIDSATFFISTLVLGLLLLSGHSSIIYLFAFSCIYATMETLDSTVRQVLVFDLVPRAQTPNALAFIQTGWSIMRVAGPSLGGFLLVWFSAGGSFLVQAGVCAVVLLTVLFLKLPPRTPEPIRTSPLQNIKEGLAYLFKEPVTRIFTLVGIVMPILAVPIFSTLPPIYAVEVFHDSSGRVLGFLVAAVGVGGVIGGLLTPFLKKWEKWGVLQMVCLGMLSLMLIAFAVISNLAAALVVLAFAGFFEIIFLTTNITLIQLSIPDKLRGRVTAAVNLTWILSPLGNMLAGAGSDLLGPKNITIILSAVAAVITLVILLLSPTVRNYRLSQNMQAKQ
jgi:MFS family permease